MSVMNFITEYKGKKAFVLSAFDKENLFWEVIKRQNEYGQDEFIITGDAIDKIVEALKVGYEAQGDVAIWKYRFEQADLCYRYAIQDQINEETEKPRTNFDRITESEEALAKAMIRTKISFRLGKCAYYTYYETVNNEGFTSYDEALSYTIEWLQKECEE